MRNLWSRGRAAALVVLGVLGLTNVFPLLAIGGGTCLTPIPVLAPLGLHLDLLSAASAPCPEHSFLPGASFGPTVQFFVLLFTTTAVAGALNLLLAIGLGYWVLRAIKSVHAWVQGHLAPAAPRLPRLLLPRLVVAEPVLLHVGIGLHHPTQRRGPPLTD